MKTITVFDPPTCCSTGVCGPDPDPKLARFAADLQWLESQGVRVERFNLLREPGEFTRHPDILQLISAQGSGALPILRVDGEPFTQGNYPTREQLAERLGLDAGASLSSRAGCGCAPSCCR